MRTRYAPIAALLTGLLVAFTPCGAAVLLVGGQEGTTDPPHPTEGAQTEEDWNPVVTCTVPGGGGIDDLLWCLLDEIATPPPPCVEGVEITGPRGGIRHLEVQPPTGDCSDPDSRQDFDVQFVGSPYFGVRIRRLVDGSEIERIALRENDPGIQTTHLENDRPDRVARIRQIEETPQGGTIQIIVDGVSVTLSLKNGSLPTAPEINGELIRQLRAGGLNLAYQAPYFYVRNHSRLPWGVHLVEFRSTDPGIKRSDLSLLDESDPTVPPPAPAGLSH